MLQKTTDRYFRLVFCYLHTPWRALSTAHQLHTLSCCLHSSIQSLRHRRTWPRCHMWSLWLTAALCLPLRQAGHSQPLNGTRTWNTHSYVNKSRKCFPVGLYYWIEVKCSFTFAESLASVRMKGFGSTVDSVTHLAPAFKTALQVSALSSLSTYSCDSTLINVCKASENKNSKVQSTTDRHWFISKKFQPTLTFAVGPIVWDEDVHVVWRAVASQAGAVVAAICVVAGGVQPTDLIGSYLTLIFIWNQKMYYS